MLARRNGNWDQYAGTCMENGREGWTNGSMNLAKDCRDVHASLCPEVVPILLLVRGWSELGGDVYSHTDLVFLLLEAVCGFEGSEEVCNK